MHVMREEHILPRRSHCLCAQQARTISEPAKKIQFSSLSYRLPQITWLWFYCIHLGSFFFPSFSFSIRFQPIQNDDYIKRSEKNSLKEKKKRWRERYNENNKIFFSFCIKLGKSFDESVDLTISIHKRHPNVDNDKYKKCAVFNGHIWSMNLFFILFFFFFHRNTLSNALLHCDDNRINELFQKLDFFLSSLCFNFELSRSMEYIFGADNQWSEVFLSFSFCYAKRNIFGWLPNHLTLAVRNVFDEIQFIFIWTEYINTPLKQYLNQHSIFCLLLLLNDNVLNYSWRS